MKILVVEDEELIAMTVIDALEAEGFSAEHASGTDEAIALAAVTPFDLALVDARLAYGDSGIATCQILLENYSVPSLLATGLDIPDHVGSFALGVLHKPFTGEELATTVRAVGKLLSGGNPGRIPDRLELFTDRLRRVS